MKDLNYVIGRLQGLNELVRILKDLVSKKDVSDSEIIGVITNHISDQLNSIIEEFDNLDVEPQHRAALTEIKEKHSDITKPPDESDEEEEPSEEGDEKKIRKHEKSVDELLKDLENLKSK